FPALQWSDPAMTRPVGLTALLAAALALATVSQVQPPAPAEDGPDVIRPAAQAAKPPYRALAWSLLPNPLDQVPGNAAPLWIRAGLAARGARYKWTERQWKWDYGGPEGTARKDLPKKEVREALDKHARAFRLIELAALRRHCDWGYPAPTVHTLSDLPLDDIEMNRELARLISLRCRLELAGGDFDAAH